MIHGRERDINYTCVCIIMSKKSGFDEVGEGISNMIKIGKQFYKLINPNAIPKNHAEVMGMLARMEKEEKEYQEKKRAIRRIKELQRIKKERKTKPNPEAIYDRCKKCDELFIKDETHECYS